MGKKKAGRQEGNDENIEVNEDGIPTKDVGKKGKKSRRKTDWEDDIAKDLEEMTLEASGIKVEKEDNATNDESNKKTEESNAPENVINGEDNSKKGKKSKKSKRKGNEDDEDIDQLLAEIESEYKGEKPKEEKSETSNIKENSKTEENQAINGVTSEKSEKKSKKKGKNTVSDTQEQNVKESTPEPSVSESKKKKDKKAKAAEKLKEEEEAKSRKGKPNKKMLEAMKEAIAKRKEEEERLRREEEERQRQEEERIRLLEEERRREEERREEKRQKQKEKMKKLKEEGKLLTPKQRLEQKRAKAMLEFLKASGIPVPEAGEKPSSAKKSKKKKQEEQLSEENEKEEEEEENMEIADDEQSKDDDTNQEVIEVQVEEEDDVADAWDQFSDSEEEDVSTPSKPEIKVPKVKGAVESSSVSEEDDCSSPESEHEHQTEAVKRKERAKNRIEQRKIDNEKNRSMEKLRAPVVCVLGHVDHGKTKILDKLRRTNVQEGEVGGITQQIGATNVPLDAIRAQSRMVKDFDIDSMRFPGLLIIDTPGHESFSNLRTRGSSLCDIAILVVDIAQGLQPQTIESINLLKARKTPFIVALNKVDRVFEWESSAAKDIRDLIKNQSTPTINDFERRKAEVIQALNSQGLNAALFWENPDPRTYVSLVPTSAITGDGMGNLMSLICTLCQKRLYPRLMFTEELQCTVLEVKTIQGHGTTIDVILVNGRLREGDTIILAGTEGPIVTQIRSLLLPKPLKEIRVKGQYDEFKEVTAALGVKIAAKELDKAIAGLQMQVAYHEDEVDLLKDDVDREFKNAMRSMKVKDKGVYVQASTLGALEALLDFFKANKVPYSGIRVGPVVKKDVMRASAMKDHDPMYAVILAFDVKVERDAQELADKEKIRIFSEETIYHLGDRYVEYIKEFKKKKQDEFRNIAVFPAKLKILPTEIHNKRSPIVLGVSVDAGVLRAGTPLCVPSKEFVEIGIVTSMEFDHKTVDMARKGVDVCIKIDPVPGHAPKLFGRHFDAEDMLVSKISRESIDACKEYFRDDLNKNDWKLMGELKKLFQIL